MTHLATNVVKLAVAYAYVYAFANYLPQQHCMIAALLLTLSFLSQIESYLLSVKYLVKCYCLYRLLNNPVYPIIIFGLFLFSDHKLLVADNIYANLADLYTNLMIVTQLS